MEGTGVRQRQKDDKNNKSDASDQAKGNRNFNFSKLSDMNSCHLASGRDEKFETMTEYAAALQKWMVQYSAWCMFQSMAFAPVANSVYTEQKTTSQTQMQPNQTNSEHRHTVEERGAVNIRYLRLFLFILMLIEMCIILIDI